VVLTEWVVILAGLPSDGGRLPTNQQLGVVTK
jgi:hypothetical protein